MLNLIITKDDISKEYTIDNNLNKDFLNNTNNIILQDNDKTMILNFEEANSDSFVLFSKISDMIIASKLQSVNELKTYFDAIKSNDTSSLDDLQNLLQKSNFSYEIIATIETEAGNDDLSDGSIFSDNFDLTNSLNHNLTNRSQLNSQDDSFSQNLNNNTFSTNNNANNTDGSGTGTTTVWTTLSPLITNVLDVNSDLSQILMSGTGIEIGNTIRLYDANNNLLGSGTVLSDFSWSIDITSAPQNFNHLIQAVEINSSNLESTLSSSTAVYVNTISQYLTLTGEEDYYFNGNYTAILYNNNNDDNNFLVFDAGGGWHSLDFRGNASAININLAGDTITIGDDTVEIKNLDLIIGTTFGDTIRANDNGNVITSWDGNDTVYGGAGNDRIDAGAGTDVIEAGDGADRIFAGDNSDLITGGKGNDVIWGGTNNLDSGIDTAVYSGTFAEYSFIQHSSYFYIIDSVANRDGTDRINLVEYLQFDDQTVSTAIFDDPSISLLSSSDSGSNTSDNISNNLSPTIQVALVSGVEAGHKIFIYVDSVKVFEYTVLTSDVSNTYANIQIPPLSSDDTYDIKASFVNLLTLEGDKSTSPLAYTLDTVGDDVSLSLNDDTGTNTSDNITGDTQININNLELTSTWQYSTDAGVNWTTGSGNSFNLALDTTYTANDIQVKVTDIAGNEAIETMNNAVTTYTNSVTAVDDTYVADASISAATAEISLSAVSVNGQQNAWGGSIGASLSDSFVYDPLNPTSNLPDLTFNANTNDGLHGKVTGDLLINYSLDTNFTQDKTYNDFVIDLYGRDAYQQTDDDFDIKLYDDNGYLIATISSLAIDNDSHLRVNVSDYFTLQDGTIISSFEIVAHNTTGSGQNYFTLMEIKAANINLASVLDEDTTIIIDVLSNDLDPQGDPLSITKVQGQDVSLGQVVNVTIASVIVGTAQVLNDKITFIPGDELDKLTTNEVRNISFAYSISDSYLETSADVNITITGTNDAPIVSIATNSALEDTIQVIGNISDIDGTVDLLSTNASASHGEVSINASGDIIYTPNENYFGGDTLKINAVDNDGKTTSESVSVNIVGVEDPIIARNNSFGDNELIIEGNNGFFVSLGGVNPTSFTLSMEVTISANSDAGRIFHKGQTFNMDIASNGTLSYTLQEDTGTRTTYDTGVQLSPSQTAYVSFSYDESTKESIVYVNGVEVYSNTQSNDFDLNPGIAGLAFGSSYGGVESSEGMIDNIQIHTQALSSSQISQISDGEIISTNLFASYDFENLTSNPVIDTSGNNNNGWLQNGLDLNINVIQEDTSLTIQASELLSNDIDVDNDSISITSVQSATNGTVILNGDNSITFTPTLTFNGLATFTYTITDGNGNYDTATVSLNIVCGSTPLILDLDNDGVETISLAKGVSFDIDADGDKDITGWVAADDGLLVRDINNDGIINDASELFGEETVKKDGTTAVDGFDALRELDSNNDGVINSDDEAYNELKVWQDSNSDGITDDGEIISLEEAGVSEISLAAKETNQVDNGNIIGLESSYTDDEGNTGEISDVWFSYTQNESISLDNTKNYTLDLSNSKNDVVEINFDKLLDVLDDNNELIILGDEEDSIILEGGVKTDDMSEGKWELTSSKEDEQGTTYNVYESQVGESCIKLIIEDNIDINNI